MRRKDREITDLQEIENIIAKARYMHLGMFDGQYPYVVPLHYGYRIKEGSILFYAHCAKEGHKLDCLRKNNCVFVEIDCGESLKIVDEPCRCGALYASVMGQGKAVEVEDSREKCTALEALMKTQTGKECKIDSRMAESVAVIKIEVGNFSAKACLR